MAVDLGKSATESASAMYNIISAGVKQEDAVEVLRLSSMAATAGVSDVTSTAKLGMAVVNAYGMEIRDLGAVYDTLFQTVRSGVTTLPELAQYLGQVLPAAKAAGVNIREVTGAIAEMTKAGIATPEAATALKGAINALAAPGEGAAKKMKELNIEWLGFSATMEKLASLHLDLPSMKEIIPDQAALGAILSLTGRFEDLKTTIDGMANSAGAAAAGYAKMARTPEQKVRELGAATHELSLSFGELITAGTPVVEVFTGVIKAINEAPDAVKLLALGLTTVTAGTLAWRAGLSTLFATASGGAASFLAMSAASPVGVLLAAAAATAGLVYWFKKQSDAQKAQAEALAADRKEVENLTYAMTFLKSKGGDLGLEKGVAHLVLAAQAGRISMQEAGVAAADYKNQVMTGLDLISHKEERLGQLRKEKTEEEKRLAKEGLEAKIKAAEQAVTATEQALQRSRDAEQKYHAQVMSLANQRLSIDQHGEDLMRGIRERKMTDLQKEVSQRQAANKKLLEAEATLGISRGQKAQGKPGLTEEEYRHAISQVQAAQALYAGLNNVDAALEGVKKSTQVLSLIYRDLEEGAKKSLESQKNETTQLSEIMGTTREKVTALKDELEVLEDKRTIVKIDADIDAARDAIKTLRDGLEELRDQTITVTAKHVEARAGGGMAGYARGGHLPGYGGGDRIQALLEAGEFVVRKEAVQAYGPGLLEAINGMRFRPPGFAAGGLIHRLEIPQLAPLPAFAGGGMVAGGIPISGIFRIDVSSPSRQASTFGTVDAAESLAQILGEKLKGIAR